MDKIKENKKNLKVGYVNSYTTRYTQCPHCGDVIEENELGSFYNEKVIKCYCGGKFKLIIKE